MLALLSWISALRFPILFGVLMLVIGIWAPRTPLLRGTFDVPARRIWGVVLCGLAAAASVVVSGWVIVMGAPARLHTVRWASDTETPMLAQAVIAAVLILPTLYRVWRMSSASLGAKALQFLAPIAAVGLTGIYLDRLLDHFTALTRHFSVPFAWIGPGYIDDQNRPEMAHIYCACWMLFTLLIYFGMGFWRLFALKRAQTFKAQVPTLSVFFILISFLVSALSELSFTLDYWHVPTLGLLAGTIGVVALFRSSDHTFAVTAVDVPAVKPVDALEAGGNEDVILVAASGGGIHLAGWTAKVLGELSRMEGFARRVRLVSSVSGGSNGSLYWLQSVYEGHVDPEKVFQAATRSSLDSVAWGLLYADLFRALIPVVPNNLDRGWALERAWMRDWKFPEHLSQWRRAVVEGRMPAVLFNTTAVETGEGITFPTTDLDPRPASLDVRRTFYEVHPGQDVSAVTAARLSATFPFVTPAARADNGETLHFADGGYFDNFGTASLAQWLRDAVPADGKGTVNRILIINITGCIPSKEEADHAASKRNKNASYLFQGYAPIQTMLEVRNASQRTTRHVELKLLQEAMAQRGVTVLNPVEFAFPSSDAPLSWHLTAKEIAGLDEAWEEMKDQRDVVARYVEGDRAHGAHA